VKTLVLKCVTLAALCAATFVITRHLAGAKAPSPPHPRGSTRTVSGAELQAARTAALEAAIPVEHASMRWHGLDVQTAGHTVSLTARAEIYETTPALHYTWLVRLYDSGSPKSHKLIDEKVYAHQRFWLAQDGEARLTPTFAETMELEAGEYRVEVSLLSFPADLDLSAIKPGVNPPAASRVAGNRRFTITEAP
jgi:hypothetical protein